MQIEKRWPPKQAKLVGKIIFSNFLELSLDKFEKQIKSVEKSSLFLKLKASGIVKNVSEAKTFTTKTTKSDNVIAKIVSARAGFLPASRHGAFGRKNKSGFSVKYFRTGFTKRYRVNPKKLLVLNSNCSDRENYQIHLLLCKLRHITTRNEFTHHILNGIIVLQKDFFLTGNYFKLKPITQKDLSDCISVAGLLRIDEGWISRIVKDRKIITPDGKELPLKFFFHKRKEKKKTLVKQILSQERQDLKSGKIEQPSSDEKLRYKLESVYGISVSKRSIGLYRKELGIPSFWKRERNYTYPPFGENFSVPYPFIFSSIDKNAEENSGVYELSLANKEIKYENEKTGTFYIGSAKNLRKRLKEHLRAKGRNGKIRKILKNNRCFFRYVVFHKDWKKEEKRLYKLFVSTFNAPPKCNKVSP